MTPRPSESMSHPKPCGKSKSLSLLGWSILLAKAAAIAFGLLIKAIIELLSHSRKGLSFHQYIGYSGVRDFQKGLDATGIQNLLPSTSKTCVRFAKKHGLEQLEIKLPDSTVAQWLGPRKATKVVVLFHGGGYMSPILNEHLSLVFGFGRAPRKDLSAVILQYDLASENANHYPRQLQQAVSLMDHLLYSKKLSPSEIILIGDSAGAHLLLGLVLHITYPRPLVSPLEVKGHFLGAALISPWIDLNSRAESLISNENKDTLTLAALQYWARNFLGNAVTDHWNSPSSVPIEWLKNVPIEEVLVLYGENELLRDDTATFVEKLEACHPRLTALAFPDEVHSHMIINRFLKINKTSESERVFVDWMNRLLRP